MDMYKPALLDSSTPDFHSRVVNVASSAHRAQHLSESDNYNFQKGGYHYGLAYANSKLATIYMANKLDRRYGHRGIHATSLHPGGININLSRNLGSEFAEQIMSIPNVFKIMKPLSKELLPLFWLPLGKHGRIKEESIWRTVKKQNVAKTIMILMELGTFARLMIPGMKNACGKTH